MKKLLDVRNIIILLLITSTALVAINPNGIMPNRTEYHEIIDSIPYPVHDTLPIEVEVEVEVEVPVEVPVEKLVEVLVYQKVDTAEIIKKYTQKVEQKEVVAVVSDATVQAKPVTKTVRDTVYTKEPPKTTYYLGFDAKFDDPNYVKLLGFGLLIKDKRERIYRVSGGVENRISLDRTTGVFAPYVGGGIYWKIGSKK